MGQGGGYHHWGVKYHWWYIYWWVIPLGCKGGSRLRWGKAKAAALSHPVLAKF